jgi:multidrug resistance protein
MFRSLPRAVWPLLLVTFVSALGFTISIPLMPYYAASFGADPLMVGMLTASYAVCALVAGPIMGQLSDRQGRRPWLLVSQLGTVAGFILTALGGSLWMLFLGRIVDGISGGNQVIAQAYVGDVAKPAERTQVYGLMGAAFGLGAVVGPVIGGLLSQINYATPFWVAAGISLASLIATAVLLPESRAADSSTPARSDHLREALAALGDPALRRLFGLYAVMTLVMGLFVGSIGLFMQLQLEVSATVAGALVAYYGVTSVLMQLLLVGPLARRLGEPRMIALGLLALVAAMATLFVAHTIPITLVSVTLLVFGMGLVRPAVTSLISQRANAERQGAAMGATQSIQSLADIVTPLAAGAMVASISPGFPGLVAALIAFAGLGLALPWGR